MPVEITHDEAIRQIRFHLDSAERLDDRIKSNIAKASVWFVALFAIVALDVLATSWLTHATEYVESEVRGRIARDARSNPSSAVGVEENNPAKAERDAHNRQLQAVREFQIELGQIHLVSVALAAIVLTYLGGLALRTWGVWGYRREMLKFVRDAEITFASVPGLTQVDRDEIKMRLGRFEIGEK